MSLNFFSIQLRGIHILGYSINQRNLYMKYRKWFCVLNFYSINRNIQLRDIQLSGVHCISIQSFLETQWSEHTCMWPPQHRKPKVFFLTKHLYNINTLWQPHHPHWVKQYTLTFKYWGCSNGTISVRNRSSTVKALRELAMDLELSPNVLCK